MADELKKDEPITDSFGSTPKPSAPAVEKKQDAVEGVSTEGLVFSTLEDGTRSYPSQKPVETIDVPAESE